MGEGAKTRFVTSVSINERKENEGNTYKRTY